MRPKRYLACPTDLIAHCSLFIDHTSNQLFPGITQSNISYIPSPLPPVSSYHQTSHPSLPISRAISLVEFKSTDLKQSDPVQNRADNPPFSYVFNPTFHQVPRQRPFFCPDLSCSEPTQTPPMPNKLSNQFLVP